MVSPTDQVMAFGDSTNDVEMLAGVRFSVAMGMVQKGQGCRFLCHCF